MAMPLIAIAAFVPLFNVTIWGKLVDPSALFANPRLVGATVTLPVEVTPVPDNETVWGLFFAESTTLKVAVRVPAAAGLNVIDIAQLADAERLVPHVLLVIEKSAAFVPETDTLLMVIKDVLPFLRVTI
jgi:hypothetical protein